MTAPMFRVRTPEELKKLTHEEHIAYTEQLVAYIAGQIADTDASVKARQARIERVKKSEGEK